MKKCVFVIVFALLMPFCVSGCKGEKVCLNKYEIVATYDEQTHQLDCEQKMMYANGTGADLDRLELFLYANSFEKIENNASISSRNRAYTNGESYGNITIKNVKSEKQECDFCLSQNHNILTINLPNWLHKDKNISIEMSYVVTLANANHRLGYGENTINFGSFAPIFCVYENGDFVHNQFTANGDPFYSEVSDYAVTINYPQKYKIASTGEIVRDDGGKAEIIAKKVRDFCFVLSDKFEVLTTNVGKTKINYFFYDDQDAKMHLKTAERAIEFFGEQFGDYPYKTLCVVKTNFCFGGMEYPNLVMIADDVQKDVTFDYVIVHEIAHQWWYGLVGNNEFEEAWLDESLTEYSSALFFEKYVEYCLKYDEIVENALQTYRQFKQVYVDVLGAVDERMDRTLSEFDTEPEYVNCVYTKGVLMYDNIREMIGKRAFLKCLRRYCKTYCFKNANRTSLVECFAKSVNKRIGGLFRAWLDGKVVVQ